MKTEKKNSCEAVAEAVASAKIEGYEIDAETENLCVMLAEDRISIEEYIGQVLKMSEAISA